MGHPDSPSPSGNTWAYGYEIAPPMSHARLKSIERLLEEEYSKATIQTRTWQGRFVVEERVTHILVVSDSPDQQLEVNRKLEAELEKLEAAYSLTPPLPVGDGASPPYSRPPAAPGI